MATLSCLPFNQWHVFYFWIDLQPVCSDTHATTHQLKPRSSSASPGPACFAKIENVSHARPSGDLDARTNPRTSARNQHSSPFEEASTPQCGGLKW
mmetsp:Transcript_6113/g.12459  ORF Transcript_6113/g.12459 Transcript_6113/m.12459 type:complete len:96 (+) Transcript_6113:919-1206(+)